MGYVHMLFGGKVVEIRSKYVEKSILKRNALIYWLFTGNWWRNQEIRIECSSFNQNTSYSFLASCSITKSTRCAVILFYTHGISSGAFLN
uniref:Uncharacterized protein n=1 Tax=Arundo donax TaxID=35708 RepID=A0A0A8YJS6_ARUDO